MRNTGNMICGGHVGAKHQAGSIRKPEFHRAGKTVSPTQKNTNNGCGVLCEGKEGEEERAQEGTQGRAQEGLEERVAQDGGWMRRNAHDKWQG